MLRKSQGRIAYDAALHDERQAIKPMTTPRAGGLIAVLSVAALSWPMVLLLALVVRGVSVLSADFPLNDGGLFLAMTMELEFVNWAVPATVHWNGSELPFAYPPLGLYAVGGIVALGVEFDAVMRVLPWVTSAAATLPILAIGHRLLASRTGSAAAALMYASAPAAFTWSLAGGGVTRGPGMLFALTTIWMMLHLRDRPTVGAAVLLGAAGGATVLTHPASSVFAAASVAIVMVAALRSAEAPRSLVRMAALAAGVSACIALPWAVVVMANHGADVFLGVPSNGPDPFVALITLVAGRVTGLGTDPLGLLVFGLAGYSALRGQLLLPVWLVAASLIGTQYAIVPASLLVGSLVVGASRLAREPQLRNRMSGRLAGGVVVALLVNEALVGVTASSVATSHLHALTVERREAMAWVADNTPEEATVAVLTGDHWSTDPDSEWFFVLAQRPSVATVQGREWLGRRAYDEAEARYARLQRCTDSPICLDAWLRDTPADYLFIPKGQRHGPNSPTDCCAEIRRELTAGTRHRTVYDGPGATIVKLGD